jgi:hypothetical protein
MGEPGFETLRMLRAGIDAAAMRHAHHHRHRNLAAEHEARLGGLIDQRVHGERDEVHEHDFDHRPQAGHGDPDGGADNGGFGNRRVAHPLGAELFQEPAGDAERATRLCDILAEQDNRGILSHGVDERAINSLAKSHFSHAAASARAGVREDLGE